MRCDGRHLRSIPPLRNPFGLPLARLGRRPPARMASGIASGRWRSRWLLLEVFWEMADGGTPPAGFNKAFMAFVPKRRRTRGRRSGDPGGRVRSPPASLGRW